MLSRVSTVFTIGVDSARYPVLSSIIYYITKLLYDKRDPGDDIRPSIQLIHAPLSRVFTRCVVSAGYPVLSSIIYYNSTIRSNPGGDDIRRSSLVDSCSLECPQFLLLVQIQLNIRYYPVCIISSAGYPVLSSMCYKFS